MKKRKVLFVVPNLRIGTGVTSVIINHYDKLIQEGYCVDFCLLQNRKSPLFTKIQEYGGHYYAMPSGKDGYPDKRKTPYFIKELIKKGNYEIIHTHIVGRFAVYVAYYAKIYHVPFRIYHAHNPRDIHDVKSYLASILFDNLNVMMNNYYLACSKDAGKSVFKDRKFEVIKNTIDANEFKFTKKKREECREELNITSNTFVVGTVCRISFQKNPYYLVDIFEKIQEIVQDAKLIWAGSGDLEGDIKQYIASKGLTHKVLLLGDSSDVSRLYAAMDAFVLPSRYEGLGIVYLEAQASGLETFASNIVPRDTEVTNLITYLQLNESPEFWAREIVRKKYTIAGRENYSKKIAEAGYDTALNNDLVEFYNKLK